MKNLEEKLNVSRETLSELKTYQELLTEWQQKFNLVSSASLSDAWNRHFLDSAQLVQFIPPSARTLIDFGSGAGFPALVLAVLTKNRTPYLKITLVESIRKKTLFLNEVCAKLNLQARIENKRIENLSRQKFDVITSRAMCSLEKLLEYAAPFCHRDTVCIFPKGCSFQEELSREQLVFGFDCLVQHNQLSDDGKILIITNINKKGDTNA